MSRLTVCSVLVGGVLLLANNEASAGLLIGPARPLTTAAGDGHLHFVGLSQPAELADAKALLPEDLKDLFTDPDRVSRGVNSYIQRTEGLDFLRDINFRLKTFHEDGGPTSLGFSYAFSRTVNGYTFGATDPTTHRGLDLSFNATGNVAFDRSVNPEDFLDTKVDVAFFQSTGGAGELSGEDQKKCQALIDALTVKFAAESDEKKIWSSPEMQQISALTLSHLSNQLAFDFAGEASLESNQSFSKKQYVYGGRLGMVFKAWDQTSVWGRWNPFDLPFAAVRYALHTDNRFSPSGTSYPAFLVGGALVDPDGQDPRAMVGDTSRFPRLRSEVSFRTRFLDLGQWGPTATLGQTYVTANYRYYWEVDASQAVRDAHLDNFGYLVATLDTKVGVFVSYSVGRLPFDAKDDKIYDLGFKFHF